MPNYQPSDPTRPSRREAVAAIIAGSIAVAARPVRAASGHLPPSEILIQGGTIVNADGILEADVRVSGERIAEIGANLTAGPTARLIDARGKLLLPGGIDPHTHIDGSFADDLTTGSEAALAGGITTVGTFAFAQGRESVLGATRRLAAQARQTAVADVILHGIAWPPTRAVAAGLEPLAAAGHPSFKLFMPMSDFHAQIPGVIRLLEAARASGVVSMIHCEDPDLLAAAVRRLTAEGHTSLQYYGASRPVIAELAATNEAIALCESTGAPIYIVHLSSARALEACRAARAAILPVYVETRPLYLHLTEEKLTGPDGPLYIGQPPLRTRADSEALWTGLADGTIDVLATDHAPWTRAQKLDSTLSITKIRPGMSDLQFMLPMYFSEGVGKRKLPLSRFVATTSTNPAKIFGLYPDKGIIREQSVADIVIWDPALAGTVRAADDRSRADYSVYEGWEVTGWPVITIRRGAVVYENGKISGGPGSGRLPTRTRMRPVRSSV